MAANDGTSGGHRSTVTVNGRPAPWWAPTRHTNALDWLRDQRPDRRQGGLRRGRVRRLLGPGRPARRRRRHPSGPRSTPAWSRPRRSTARRSSPPRASARRTALHPVQHEMAVRGGSQCGYCTPGFVCSMAAEFYRAEPLPRRPTSRRPHAEAGRRRARRQRVRPARPVSGNLCRCTGYRPIRDAAYALGSPGRRRPVRRPARASRPPAAGADPPRRRPAAPSSGRATSPRPWPLLAEHPDAVARRRARTDWGVEVNLRGARARVRRSAIDRLPELRDARASATTSSRSAPRSRLTEVERRPGGPDAAAGRSCSRSSPRG